MQDFLSKAGKAAKNTAGKAADKASDLVEVGKLKAKINSAKSRVSALEQKMGHYYFEQYMDGMAVDAVVGAMCEEIKLQLDDIRLLEMKIQDVKASNSATSN